MRYSTNARGRVFLATIAFGIFGAIGCESVVAPEVDRQDQVVTSADDEAREDEGARGFGDDSQGTWEPERAPRTDKYREE